VPPTDLRPRRQTWNVPLPHLEPLLQVEGLRTNRSALAPTRPLPDVASGTPRPPGSSVPTLPGACWPPPRHRPAGGARNKKRRGTRYHARYANE
jgi:hypothetical protein